MSGSCCTELMDLGYLVAFAAGVIVGGFAMFLAIFGAFAAAGH